MGDIATTNIEEEYRLKSYKDVSVVENLKIICTACQGDIKHVVLLKEKVYEHPLLGVILCKHCHSFYNRGEFSADEDGVDKYCRWCGQGGHLFVCHNCPKAFCKKCIKSNLGRNFLQSVQESSWECISCKPEPLYKLRALCWAVKEHIINKKRKLELAKTKKPKHTKTKKPPVKNEESSAKSVQPVEFDLNKPLLELEKLTDINDNVLIEGIVIAKTWLVKFSNDLVEFWNHIGQSIADTNLECHNIETIEDINLISIGFGRSMEDTIKMLTNFEKKHRTYLKNFQKRLLTNNRKSKNSTASIEGAQQINDSDEDCVILLDNDVEDVISIKDDDDDDDVVVNGLDSPQLAKPSLKPKRKNISPSTTIGDVFDTIVNEVLESPSPLNKTEMKKNFGSRNSVYDDNVDIVNTSDNSKKNNHTVGEGVDDIVSNEISSLTPHTPENSSDDIINSDNENQDSENKSTSKQRDDLEIEKQVTPTKSPTMSTNENSEQEDVAKEKEKTDKNSSSTNLKPESDIDNTSSSESKTNDNTLSTKSKTNDSSNVKEDTNKESSSGTDPLDTDSDRDTKIRVKKEKISPKNCSEKLNLGSDEDVFEDTKKRKKKKSKRNQKFFSDQDQDSSSCEEFPIRKKLIKKSKKKSKKKRRKEKERFFSSTEDEVENIKKYLSSATTFSYIPKSGSEDMSSKSEDEENQLTEIKEKELSILDCLTDTDLTPVEDVDDQLDYLRNGGAIQDWDLDNVQLFDDTGSEQVTSEPEEEEVKKKKVKRKPSDSDESSGTYKRKALRKKGRFVEDKLLKDEPDSGKEEKKWSKKIALDQQNKKNKSSDSDSDVFVPDDKSKKKKKKVLRKERLLSSESEKASSSSSDDDDKNSSTSASSVEEVMPKKRRRIQKVSDSDSSGEDDGNGGKIPLSGGKGRKNIKKILKGDEIRKSTKTALKEEQDRKKRIAEKQKLYNELISQMPQESAELKELILDFDPETKKALVSVHKDVVKKLKPHQAEGIKFMWDSCFESVEDAKKKRGSGCILAHCMGLGKTLQVVALLHTLFSHEQTGINTVLVLCPVSTVLNWASEFRKWLDDVESDTDIEVYHFDRTQNEYRSAMLKEWKRTGGVFIMGYNMIRSLTSPGNKMKKKFKDAFTNALLDPGPDLVVCDEGHILKNQATAIAKTMTRMKTLRRIVLTGTPLQNNLIEYHCMVQFIKPDLLGTKKEFQNRFVNPIQNGQFEDSTSHDVKVMKRRAHVLHTMLDGIVQRKDYNVLTPYLPHKFEYVIHLKLSDLQCKLYKYYLEKLVDTSQTRRSLFADFLCLLRVCLHPRALLLKSEKDAIAKEKLDESDEEGSLKDFIDDGDGYDTETSDSLAETSDSDKSVELKPNPKKTTRSQGPAEPEQPLPEEINKASEWWTDLVKEEEFDDIKQSPKMFLFFQILKHCEEIGDKLLVFSQSLYTLDIIEYFLAIATAQARSNEPDPEWAPFASKWIPGHDYFRLDGTTNMDNRSKCCRNFNDEENLRSRLFLISTKAGGLGINLTGANRVILFDACWNPSYDVQSIFRIYRFGQTKPCYIYRFLCKGTMEEKIYERQVAKLSTSLRVIDEQQIDRHFTHSDLAELYTFNPEESGLRGIPILPKDRLMAELIQSFGDIILSYHQHDSLLQNQEDEGLTEEERKAAWNDFENEKNPPPPTINTNANSSVYNMYMMYNTIKEKLRQQNPTMSEELVHQRAVGVMQAYKDQQQASAIRYGNQPYTNNMAYNFGVGMGVAGASRPQMMLPRHATPMLRPMSQQQQPNQSQPRPGFSGIPNINIPF